MQTGFDFFCLCPCPGNVAGSAGNYVHLQIMRAVRLKYIFCALALMICALAQGQVKIYTKKSRLADFPAKTTVVVLSGNEILDLALKNEITSRWRVSPFDFREPENMDELRRNPSIYLLYLSDDRKGIVFLNLEKCGTKGGMTSLSSQMDVVKVPFSPRDFTTGREISYLSAAIDIMQHYVENAIRNESGSYASLKQFCKPLVNQKKKQIFISHDDLSTSIAGRDSLANMGDGIVFTDSFTADSLFAAGAKDALIGFCISSSVPGPKSESYQIIVSADRHELYYFDKSAYKKEENRGFSDKALKRIRVQHAYKKQ